MSTFKKGDLFVLNNSPYSGIFKCTKKSSLNCVTGVIIADSKFEKIDGKTERDFAISSHCMLTVKFDISKEIKKIEKEILILNNKKQNLIKMEQENV